MVDLQDLQRLPQDCDKFRRAHTILARSSAMKIQNFLKKTFTNSLEKNLIFQFYLYFSASFTFYFLVS